MRTGHLGIPRERDVVLVRAPDRDRVGDESAEHELAGVGAIGDVRRSGPVGLQDGGEFAGGELIGPRGTDRIIEGGRTPSLRSSSPPRMARRVARCACGSPSPPSGSRSPSCLRRRPARPERSIPPTAASCRSRACASSRSRSRRKAAARTRSRAAARTSTTTRCWRSSRPRAPSTRRSAAATGSPTCRMTSWRWTSRRRTSRMEGPAAGRSCSPATASWSRASMRPAVPPW